MNVHRSIDDNQHASHETHVRAEWEPALRNPNVVDALVLATVLIGIAFGVALVWGAA